MECLFDPSKPHFSAWVWLHDIDRHWIEPMSTMHPTRPAAVPLYYASLCGFGGLVENLIAAKSKDIDSRGGRHTTPLHAAAFKRHLEVASLLLKNRAEPNSLDKMARTPLYKAIRLGQPVEMESSLEIARLLVNSGADVNLSGNDGWTPLHAAAVSGRRDITELLLESGAILDIGDKDGDTPLHEARGRNQSCSV
jgi:ankyrin repeat protein